MAFSAPDLPDNAHLYRGYRESPEAIEQVFRDLDRTADPVIKSFILRLHVLAGNISEIAGYRLHRDLGIPRISARSPS